MKSTFDYINPRMEFVSRSLGYTQFETFVRVSLPLAGSGILASTVIVFGERPVNSSIQNLVQATLEDYYKEGILYHLSFRCGDVLIPAVVTTSAFHEMDLRRDATKYLGVKAANVKLT